MMGRIGRGGVIARKCQPGETGHQSLGDCFLSEDGESYFVTEDEVEYLAQEE